MLWDHWAALLYDRWHGVEAGKRGVRVPYDPTQPKYIRWAFRNLPIDPAAYSFVDFGSGKGRVLIAAAERPFLRVVGVEYSRDLHEAAVANIGSAKRIKCRDTTSLCMDAAEFSIPETPCVLYFYNPFRGETMDRVLSNIQASLTRAPRPLFLVYVNPVLHDVFMRKPGMRLIKGGGGATCIPGMVDDRGDPPQHRSKLAATQPRFAAVDRFRAAVRGSRFCRDKFVAD